MREGIVTVVGGTGFLGRYVVRALAREGFVVHVLSRSPKEAAEFKTFGDVGQIVIDYADITKPQTLEGKLKGSYAVVNLVGVLYERGSQNFTSLHAQGAEKLAKLAKAEGAERFVHISALGVETAVDSKYARTKLLGERAACSAMPQTTVLRPGIMFGPEDAFFNKFAQWACYAPFLPLIGGGKTRFQPVYAGDVATAVARALTGSSMVGKTYELGGQESYTFKQLMQFVCDITQRGPALVDVPFRAAKAIGALAELSPLPPMLTRDQVCLLKYDNVVSGQALTFSHLGIHPAGIDAIVPPYLSRFVKYAPGGAAA